MDAAAAAARPSRAGLARVSIEMYTSVKRSTGRVPGGALYRPAAGSRAGAV